MSDVMKFVSTFIDSVAVLMALVLMWSLVQRKGRSRFFKNAFMGGVFSLAIILSMSDPIIMPQKSGIFDMRTLLVGTAAGLLGPVVGTIALITASAYRVVIGEPGVIAGLVGVGLSYAMGLVWHFFVKDLPFETWKKSVALGGMLSVQVLAIFIVPAHLWVELFLNLAPYMVASSVLGALIINHLLSGEISFLSEAEASKIDANTDHLTGLLNRRGLDLVYPNVLDLGPQSRGQALLYFDIDRFKTTNDTHGHAVGDDVLRHVVDHIAANLRQKDTFVRLGGDEFVVVLPDITCEEAETIAERCRCVVDKSGFEVGFKVLPISISVGAVWSGTPARIDALINFADRALYQAKEKGRNAVVFIRQSGETLPSAA
ncbi:diguanylate cyclase [Octadecabacter sp.]|nr:diguanylate cyclase [Octadecabacter sp.]